MDKPLTRIEAVMLIFVAVTLQQNPWFLGVYLWIAISLFAINQLLNIINLLKKEKE